MFLYTLHIVFVRPFSIVAGAGFQAVAQKLINIGHQYGNIPASTLIPCPTTVSRHLQSVVTTEKSLMRSRMKRASNFGLTTDGWTSELTNAQFITVTIHFLDRKWSMNSLILATREAEEKHTAENVRTLTRTILDEYGAYHNGIVYITDNAANMKAAFKDEIWAGCAGHNLNLVLSHGLQPPKDSSVSDGVPAEVTSLITTCKDLVTLAKRTKLNHKLEKTLKQCVSTRWNSVLTTLKSVLENLDELRTIASEKDANKNLIRLMCDIDEDLLGQVIGVLQPFDEATRVLSTDSSPSLNLVVPTFNRLSLHLEPTATDLHTIDQLKIHLMIQLQRYFKITDIHAAAALLDPRLKNKMNLMSAELRTRAIATLRKLKSQHIQRQLIKAQAKALKKEQKQQNAASTTSSDDDSSDNSDNEAKEPPLKKTMVNIESQAMDFFGDMFATEEAPAPADEIDLYLDSPGKNLFSFISKCCDNYYLHSYT
jgi:hypothetical protein